jgi:plasmid stabilization system protein ParE
MRKLYEKIRALKNAPYLGQSGRVEGTRELLFPPMPYVAVYSVYEQTIEIWAHLPHVAGPGIVACV